jgi:hypothetical protein
MRIRNICKKKSYILIFTISFLSTLSTTAICHVLIKIKSSSFKTNGQKEDALRHIFRESIIGNRLALISGVFHKVTNLTGELPSQSCLRITWYVPAVSTSHKERSRILPTVRFYVITQILYRTLGAITKVGPRWNDVKR